MCDQFQLVGLLRQAELRDFFQEEPPMELFRAALPICAEGYLGTFLVILVIAGVVKLLMLLS